MKPDSISPILQTPAEIEAWLRAHKVKLYKIIKNSFTDPVRAAYPFVVNVEGNVDLNNKSLTYLPILFGHISGNFDCSQNQLKNLVGAPHYVEGNFNCSKNLLTDLLGAPTTVNNQFVCNKNYLKSLKHCPKNFMRGFYCADNWLTSLEFSPKEVKLDFIASNNRLSSLKHCPEKIGGNFAVINNRIEDLAYFPEKSSWFSCEENPLLGKAQKLKDFSDFYPIHLKHKEILEITQERNQLNNNIVMGLDTDLKQRSPKPTVKI